MCVSGPHRRHTHSAVRDPLLMAVLLGAPQLHGELGGVNVGVELSHRAEHDHLGRAGESVRETRDHEERHHQQLPNPSWIGPSNVRADSLYTLPRQHAYIKAHSLNVSHARP